MFPSQNVSPDPEVILCNNMKLLRECLSVSGEGLGAVHREQENDYVYDLYYQETAQPGWIQDILSVRAYADEGELVCVWTDGRTGGHRQTGGWMGGWMASWNDGRVDGFASWTEGWTGGWMSGEFGAIWNEWSECPEYLSS